MKRLADSATLAAGRACWVVAMPDGPPLFAMGTDAWTIVPWSFPNFPLGKISLGALIVSKDSMVGDIRETVKKKLSIDILIADAEAFETSLRLVATGLGSLQDVAALRDAVIDTVSDIVKETTVAVVWVPWAIAGLALVGLVVTIIVAVKT